MINKIKSISSKKYFHMAVIILIVIMLLFVLGIIVLKYNVEGETNMPFELTKISVISSSEGIDVNTTETRWAFDVYQSNDIYLYIDKNNNYKKTEAIEKIIIDNVKIEGTKKDNIKLYKPDLESEKQIFKNVDENIVENLEYKGSMESSLKHMIVSNQGGIIAFRCSNNNLARYTSNDEEINHFELLKKAGVKQEDLDIKLTFDLTIKLTQSNQYKSTITLNLPIGDIIEEGTTSKEITDMKDFIFKRDNG